MPSQHELSQKNEQSLFFCHYEVLCSECLNFQLSSKNCYSHNICNLLSTLQVKEGVNQGYLTHGHLFVFCVALIHMCIHTLYIPWIHGCVIKTFGCGTSHKIHKVCRILQWRNSTNVLYNSIIFFTHKKFIYRVKGMCI